MSYWGVTTATIKGKTYNTTDTFICQSARSGKAASDGSGNNSITLTPGATYYFIAYWPGGLYPIAVSDYPTTWGDYGNNDIIGWFQDDIFPDGAHNIVLNSNGYNFKNNIPGSIQKYTGQSAQLPTTTPIAYSNINQDVKWEVSFIGAKTITNSVISDIQSHEFYPSISTKLKSSASFNCWNTEPDGTGTSYKPGDLITSDSINILYAIWTESSLYDSITLPKPINYSVQVKHPVSVSFEGFGTRYYLQSIGYNDQPRLTNKYIFKNWTAGNPGDIYSTSSVISLSENIYAICDTEIIPALVTPPAVDDKDGFVFAGWSTDKDAVKGDASDQLKIYTTESQHYYPIWRAIENDIIISSNDMVEDPVTELTYDSFYNLLYKIVYNLLRLYSTDTTKANDLTLLKNIIINKQEANFTGNIYRTQMQEFIDYIWNTQSGQTNTLCTLYNDKVSQNRQIATTFNLPSGKILKSTRNDLLTILNTMETTLKDGTIYYLA